MPCPHPAGAGGRQREKGEVGTALGRAQAGGETGWRCRWNLGNVWWEVPGASPAVGKAGSVTGDTGVVTRVERAGQSPCPHPRVCGCTNGDTGPRDIDSPGSGAVPPPHTREGGPAVSRSPHLPSHCFQSPEPGSVPDSSRASPSRVLLLGAAPGAPPEDEEPPGAGGAAFPGAASRPRPPRPRRPSGPRAGTAVERRTAGGSPDPREPPDLFSPSPLPQGMPVPEPLPWSARGSPEAAAAAAAALELLREEGAGEGREDSGRRLSVRPLPSHPLRSLPGPPAAPQKRKSRPVPAPLPPPVPVPLTAALSAGDMHDFFVGLMGKRAAGRASGGPALRCSPEPPAPGEPRLRAA